jgi:hypothetical protein
LRLPPAVQPNAAGEPRRQPPDFTGFFHRLAETTDGAQRPLDRARDQLLEASNHLYPDQRQAIRQVLGAARAVKGSFTHRTFQELVLGSATFSQVYAQPPALAVESYLLKYDRPLISAAARDGLLRWMQTAGGAAIMTSRPSQPLPGVFSTPEAELGARLVGLEDLPIVGLGGLNWLAERRGVAAPTFLKPSPVHALAACLRAAGLPLEESLLQAAALADEAAADAWRLLEAARICVFEDSPAGMHSARKAVELLGRAGVTAALELYGIAEHAEKAGALRRQGAVVFPTVEAALQAAKVCQPA